MIEPELFERIQEIKGEKQVSIRYKNPIGHALRGFVRCVQCRRVYTPYTKKGIQYFGSRCAPGCSNTKKSCNLAFIETELGKRLPELFLTPEELEDLDQNTDTSLALLEAKLERERSQVERQQRKLGEDLSYLRRNRLELLKSGVYSPDAYVEEEQRLLGEINDGQQKGTVSQTALHETIKEATKLSELLKHLTVYYEEANSAEKEAIARSLFSELTMDHKTFDYSLRNEFRALKKPSAGLSAPDLGISEPTNHKFTETELSAYVELGEILIRIRERQKITS